MREVVCIAIRTNSPETVYGPKSYASEATAAVQELIMLTGLRNDYLVRGFFKKCALVLAAFSLSFPLIVPLYFSSPLLALLQVVVIWPFVAILVVTGDFLVHWLRGR
jgi:hypothetical protein